MIKIINESIKTIYDLNIRDYLDKLNVTLSSELTSLNSLLIITRIDDVTSRIYLSKKSILTIKVIQDKLSYTVLLTDYQDNTQIIDIDSIFETPDYNVVDNISKMLMKLNLEESKKTCTRIDI